MGLRRVYRYAARDDASNIIIIGAEFVILPGMR